MLRRVRIRGYKSLRDVEVRFDRPLSIIIGANASGKSNLFDALALLRRMVTQPTLREAFDEHRGSPLEAFSFGSEGIEGLLKQNSAVFSIEVDIELSPDTIELVNQQSTSDIPYGVRTHKPRTATTETLDEFVRFLSYKVVIQIDATSGDLSVTQERLSLLNANLAPKQGQNVIAERTHFQIRINTHGKIGSGTFSASQDRTLFSQPIFLSLHPINAAFQEISHWRFYDLEPKAMREPAALRDVKALGPTGGDLTAFFNSMQIERPKQFEGIRRALRLLIPQITDFKIERSSDGYLQLIVREDEIPYRSRVISAGTLRVLALLALTNPLEPATLLGIEEPENGVDPHHLRFIADLLKTTTGQRGIQALVNTHSPLLPRYFSEDELIYCWRAGADTVFEPVKTSGLWRDPITVEKRLSIDDDEAEPAAPLTTTP
ncbi:MAG TPA: AAA family ATPase [Ktedonobacterales bacterium]|jgi:predicted ATPase